VTQRQTVVRPGKNFFPGAPELPVDRYQQLLAGHGPKLLLGLRLIGDYGLAPLVRLGDSLLVQPADLAILSRRGLNEGQSLSRLSINQRGKLSNYLYANCLHPTFFTDTVHLLGTKAVEIKEKVLEVKLRNLGRDQIARACAVGKLNTLDLDQGDFDRFAERPVREKLAVLEKLGVLVMKPGETFYAMRQLDLIR
jgi:hypothetical protein